MLLCSDAIRRAIVSRKQSSALFGRGCNHLNGRLAPATPSIRYHLDRGICSTPLYGRWRNKQRHDVIALSTDAASSTLPAPTPSNLVQSGHDGNHIRLRTRYPSLNLIPSPVQSMWPLSSIGTLSKRALVPPNAFGSNRSLLLMSRPNSTLANRRTVARFNQRDTLLRRADVMSKPEISFKGSRPAEGDAQTSTVVHDASLRDTINTKRAQRAYEGTKKSRQDRAEYERAMRPNGGLTWKDILEELRISTPTPAASQPEIKISGLELHQTSKVTESERREGNHPYFPVSAAPGLTKPGAGRIQDREYLASSASWLKDQLAAFHNIALGNKQSVPSGRTSHAGLSVPTTCSPPIDRVFDNDIAAHDLLTSTPDDFRTYIRALSRRGYPIPNSRTDVETVTQLLREAFHDTPSAANVATTEEFNIALAFFHRYRKLPEARELFALMEESNCKLDATTFNIFIHNAANEQNVPAFHLWLRRMQHRDIAPDCSTWVALLEIAPSPGKKQEVALEIHRKHLIQDRATAVLVFRKVIAYSFDSFLENGGDISTYLETLQHLIGYNLDDTYAVRQMLDVLASRGRFNQALHLVHGLSLHGYNPSVSDLKIMLLHCYKHLNGDTAVNVVGVFYHTWNVQPDATTMQHLFKLFWRARMYNATWATWTYSCMWGYVSYKMKTTLLKSLQNSLTGVPNTARHRWDSNVGAVLLDAASKGDSATQRLTHSIQQHSSESPTVSFSHILLKAMIRDQSWTKRRLKNSTSAQWKVENRIHIPVLIHGAGSRTGEYKKDALDLGGANSRIDL